jgi:hypothetical protein
MATTTNYAWETPDDTDLVKDGAAAIRTLGSSVDTTTKALNPSTTLGDIEYRSSTANTNTRLAVGTTGQVLTVSGGVPAWATPASGSLTLLSTTNLSGTSTTVSGISGAHTDLLVIVNNPFFNVGAALRINPNASASQSYHSGTQGSTAISDNNITSHTSSLLPTSSDARTTFALYIRQYSQATYGKAFTFGGGNDSAAKAVNRAGNIYLTAAITSLVFTTDAGTSTFSGGQVLIYGVK